MALKKKTIIAIQFFSLVYGVGAFVTFYKFGAPGPAALNFCLASLFAWIVSTSRTKTFLSFLGLAVIILSAIAVVSSGRTDINSWFTVKLVFVIYFGIFVGHIAGAFSKGNAYIYNGIIGALLAICVVVKYSLLPDSPDWLDPVAQIVSSVGVYGLADLLEDAAFGLAGALAAEILKAAEITSPTGP